MSCVLRISVITIWTVEPWMKTPALICRCLQALAEALKINASVTSIGLISNDIGDEGVKAWCVEGSAESLNAAACHDVTFPYFPGILWQRQVNRVKLSAKYIDAEWKCGFLDCFSKFESERFDISHLNVNCSRDFSDQVLTVETTNEMPTLICRCLQALAEALKINMCATKILLLKNQIGAEGAKAWCVVGSAACCGMSWCHVFDILWQWEVWLVWRCCSFIVHLGLRLAQCAALCCPLATDSSTKPGPDGGDGGAKEEGRSLGMSSLRPGQLWGEAMDPLF